MSALPPKNGHRSANWVHFVIREIDTPTRVGRVQHGLRRFEMLKLWGRSTEGPASIDLTS
jgi:hypothetical protein